MTLSARLLLPAALTAFGAALAWAYGPTACAMIEKWSNDPQYSHGFLVPAFAVYLLWHRRALFPDTTATAGPAGLFAVASGVGLHLAGAYFYLDVLATLALLPTLVGLTLLAGGWSMSRWAWPSIGFLGFMLPLPYRLEIALSHPLQRLATDCSTYLLQTMGLAAIAEGNVIILDNARIGVVEACNGLGMLVTFFAMTAATTLVVQRTFVEKFVIALSAVPIALIANVVRISVTGFLLGKVGGEVANAVYHDLAGWLMMPIALGLLWAQCRVLSWVLVDKEPEAPVTLGLGISLATLDARNDAKTQAAVV